MIIAITKIVNYLKKFWFRYLDELYGWEYSMGIDYGPEYIYMLYIKRNKRTGVMIIVDERVVTRKAKERNFTANGTYIN